MALQQTQLRPKQEGFTGFVEYVFYKFDMEWWHLEDADREAARQDFLSKMRDHETKLSLRHYSLVGTRSDADFMLWMISDSIERFQEVRSELSKTILARCLSMTHSFLGMFRASEYFGKSSDAKPVGSKYLFVYPLTKKREWYGLPFEERQRIIRNHVQIGHKYSSVTIHTAYSFGLDDYEFILSFETDYPEDFLNLVMALRGSEASKYTAIETPLFTCISTTPENLLRLLGP